MRVARPISLPLIGALVFSVALAGCSAIDSVTELHSMGLLVTAASTYESLPKASPSGTLSALPASVDLSSEFPSPGNQGQQDSCVAWAVGYGLKSYQEYVKKGWSLLDDSHLMSPAFIFNQIKAGDGSAGSYMEDALNLLMVKGDCSLATMPYDYSDNSAQPSQAALTEAMQYRIGSWSRIQQNSISDIKGFLANDSRPVILGIKVFSDFDNLDANNPVYNVAKGTSRGNHAIVLIGYDDAQQAFKFINCWGTGWGLGGYGWLAYSFVDTAAISGYVAVDATP